MIEIYEKRGRWVVAEPNGRIHKFATEAEAKEAFGFTTRPEVLDSLHKVTSEYANTLKELDDGEEEEE